MVNLAIAKKIYKKILKKWVERSYAMVILLLRFSILFLAFLTMISSISKFFNTLGMIYKTYFNFSFCAYRDFCYYKIILI